MIRTFLSLWLAAAPASDDARARASALADEAETLWANDDLQGAQEALARAYQLDPNPYFLFGRGRLAAEAKDCESAVALMREFLELYPEADGHEDARAVIEGCGETVSPPTPPTPAEPPPPIVAPPEAPRTDPADDQTVRAWHRDPVGGILVGAGGVGLATGLGLFVGAIVERNGAEDAATTDAYRDSISRTRGLETSGVIVAAVGGALAVGGVIRYVLVAKRGRERPQLGLGLTKIRF